MAKKKENNQKSGASVMTLPILKMIFNLVVLVSYFTTNLNFVRVCSRSEIRANSHFTHLTTNFLPFWMYRPGLVILFTFKPLMV